MEEKKANTVEMNEPEDILVASQEMGFKAAEFFQKKNYITAKTLLIQACGNLLKLSKTSRSNPVIKDLLNNFLLKAEECQQAIRGLYKINV